ncbi:hypothetical protein Lgee_1786 [Legionella geestiana]|uniref:Uncharacterized protein n=1 Tax=Legionella geestiana TaxID=45065 RepID=A0A0W0TPI4_9GAMM|nr:hypothetical protein [Legionella geestiana]KTC97465.1 hypothetical protein Lgee_1786 [Legionella geestiana]QBS13329.1 hypothetical protein E4T54_11545 [Legionella geestiana]QDQ40927.1 hypothetical protein E3226_011185 [Legionella geestiana]STX54142.1 Uncharacterised protein [Legionella geestiana]
MRQPLILLHEESLRMTHPVFQAAPAGTSAVYIWDDEYARRTAYSFKRFVFNYETLCHLNVDILHGDTLKILQDINPSIVYIPGTNNPLLIEVIDSIKAFYTVELVEDEPFVKLNKTMDYRRFFQYWNHAKKTAFLYNGGLDD